MKTLNASIGKICLFFIFKIKFINIQSVWINLKPVSRVIYYTKLLHKKGFLVLFSIPLTDSIRSVKANQKKKKNNHFPMQKCYQLVVLFRYDVVYLYLLGIYNRISTTFLNTSHLMGIFQFGA